MKKRNELWMKVREGDSLDKVQALAAWAYVAVQLMSDKTPANKACSRLPVGGRVLPAKKSNRKGSAPAKSG